MLDAGVATIKLRLRMPMQWGRATAQYNTQKTDWVPTLNAVLDVKARLEQQACQQPSTACESGHPQPRTDCKPALTLFQPWTVLHDSPTSHYPFQPPTAHEPSASLTISDSPPLFLHNPPHPSTPSAPLHHPIQPWAGAVFRPEPNPTQTIHNTQGRTPQSPAASPTAMSCWMSCMIQSRTGPTPTAPRWRLHWNSPTPIWGPTGVLWTLPGLVSLSWCPVC